MRYFDEKLENEISPSAVDYLKYKFERSKRFLKHHEEKKTQEEEWHLITKMVEKDGKMVRDIIKVIDSPKQEIDASWDEYEDCFALVPLTESEIKSILREKRETECFKLVDRSQMWYEGLSDEQKKELSSWYTAWLHVTDTMEIPTKPKWLDGK